MNQTPPPLCIYCSSLRERQPERCALGCGYRVALSGHGEAREEALAKKHRHDPQLYVVQFFLAIALVLIMLNLC